MEWIKNNKKTVGIGCGCAIVAFFLTVIMVILAWIFVPKLLKKSDPIVFQSYELTDEATSPQGLPLGISIKIDIPQGDHPKIEGAIRQIINKSSVVQALGEPIGETLQQVADNCVELFKERAKTDEFGYVQFDLLIEYEYQNKECVVFHVADGVYGNGGPKEYNVVVRKEDGHVMEQSEMIFIAEEKLRALAEKHYSTEEGFEVFLGDGYYVSPCAEGVKLQWPVGSHFLGECVIPLNEIESYLTEEGKPLFTAEGYDETEQATAAAPAEEEGEEVAAIEEETAEPDVAKGDLAAFELVGPVKECTFRSSDFKIRRTFDKNGHWTKLDGNSVSTFFAGGISRDSQDRIVKGKTDPYEDLYVSYKYNASGQISEIVDAEYYDGGSISTFNYNGNGELVSITTQYTGMDAIEDEETGEETPPSVDHVTILERDAHGNWTKRKLGSTTQTRTITYYD